MDKDLRSRDDRPEGVDADIDAILGKPKTPDDLIEDAKWWLREAHGPLPEAAPIFKALCQVVEENERLRLGFCDEAYILMVQAVDYGSLPKGRKRILTEQAVRMAKVGLSLGWPRYADRRVTLRALDVLAALDPSATGPSPSAERRAEGPNPEGGQDAA